MATPVMIMGTKVGLDMINQIKGIACIIIDDNDIIHTFKKYKPQINMVKLTLRILAIITSLLTVSLFLVSCQTVKEYQKNKLNDAEMSLSNRKLKKQELNFQIVS
jgi:hypothetical protein